MTRIHYGQTSRPMRPAYEHHPAKGWMSLMILAKSEPLPGFLRDEMRQPGAPICPANVCPALLIFLPQLT